MRNLDILAAENGEHVRVLLCGEEQSYVVSCQHFRMPYPVASDLLAELQPVPAETYSVFVLDEDITNRQREGRNRKLDLIAPLLVDTCIYDKSHRNEVVRRIAAEHGIARRTLLQYLWRYWVYQSKNALLPAERPAPEQHELTADEKAIRWALNKYYYTPQRQSLQTAYKMMLRAKYCDARGTLKAEYPTFWQFRYFFRKNRDPISETISRQGLKAYQRNHRPFTGSVCDYAHTIGQHCYHTNLQRAGKYREYYPCCFRAGKGVPYSRHRRRFTGWNSRHREKTARGVPRTSVHVGAQR